jgi:hypothetical protein
MWICRVKKIIYGYSGNELMPPVEGNEFYIYHSEPEETLPDFQKRMSETVLPMRRAADAAKAKPYSIRDGWDWEIMDITPRPMPKIEEVYP